MKIDLSLEAPLDFSGVQVEGIVEINFGLTASLFHPLFSSSHLMALKEFSAQVLEVQKEKISGLILHRTDVHEPFEEAKEILSKLAHVLHTFGAVIPETIPLYVHFTTSRSYTLAELSVLFSRERFLHLHVRVEGSRLPFEEKEAPSWGVLIPQEHVIDYLLVGEMLEEMLQKGVPFRLLPELFACELWHGIDYILFMPNLLTKEGKRMLQGFSAAGGEVIPAGLKDSG